MIAVPRENITIHNEIHWRKTKIVIAIQEKCELQDVFEMLGKNSIVVSSK
jgi:hypothetical protein